MYLDVLVVQIEVVGLGAFLEGITGSDVLLAAEGRHRHRPAVLEAKQVVRQSAVTVQLPRKAGSQYAVVNGTPHFRSRSFRKRI